MNKYELITYKNIPNCIRLYNEKIELVIPTTFGPRVLFFGFVGQVNEFANFDEQISDPNYSGYRFYGGHRFWISPETDDITYLPDDATLDYTFENDTLTITQKTDNNSHLIKSISFYIDENSIVTVTHKLTNTGLWSANLAPWALSMMAPGGTVMIKQNDTELRYLPNRSVILWPYSQMNDSRIVWGDKYILLNSSENIEHPFKLGIQNKYGFAAYFNNNNLFITKHQHDDNLIYPDMNSSFETYTCNTFTEIETLGALIDLAPNTSCEHIETWQLIKDVPRPTTEKECDEIFNKYIGG